MSDYMKIFVLQSCWEQCHFSNFLLDIHHNNYGKVYLSLFFLLEHINNSLTIIFIQYIYGRYSYVIKFSHYWTIYCYIRVFSQWFDSVLYHICCRTLYCGTLYCGTLNYWTLNCGTLNSDTVIGNTVLMMLYWRLHSTIYFCIFYLKNLPFYYVYFTILLCIFYHLILYILT